MSRYRRRSGVKTTTRSRSGGRRSRASSQRFRVSARRKGYGRTSGYYGRYLPGKAQELKFHDLDITDADVAVNGTIIEPSCNLIAQGVTESQRIGRKCTIKSINWRFNIQLDNGVATQTTGETVRIILYLDKQANGAAATVTAILEADDYQSFNNLANKSRFRTLMDRTFDLNVQAASGNGTTDDTSRFAVNDAFYKKCNIPIEYDSTTGALTEIRSNNIGVLILGRFGTQASFLSKMRLRFSDQ